MNRKYGLFGMFALFVLLLSAAHARLGDTETELINRFGRPLSRSKHAVSAQGRTFTLGPTLAFAQNDWNITCDLIDDRCVRILYTKRGDWSEDQVRLVLNANAQGAQWKEKSPNPSFLRDWSRSDGSTAQWSINRMTLVWDAYNKAKAQVEERAKVETKKKPKI